MSPADTRGATPSQPRRRALDVEFERLDARVPLLLLPVRIETLFDRSIRTTPEFGRKSKEAAQPAVLLVRIYPDDVHADTHVRGLTRAEIVLGERFWKSAWLPVSTRERQERTFAKLAARLGAFRAAWALEATRPLNWDRRGGDPTNRQPLFGDPPQRDRIAPGRARLLPDRWIVSLYQHNQLVVTKEGKAIPRKLAISPDLAATGAPPKTIGDLLQAQGLAWMREFEAAEEAGMAVRIPLGDQFSSREPLDLFVVGARSGETSEDVAQQLAELLAAHHWTHGVDFVPRGTPTNNSDRASSGVSLSEPDTAALLDAVLMRPAARARPDEPLYRRRFDAAATLALGLEPGSILERVANRNQMQLDLAAAMSAALWPATCGHFLRTMLGNTLSDEWIAWLRRHFIVNVRGGGVLPAVRVGRQPYGLHPVAPEMLRERPLDRIDTLENMLLAFLPAWDDAVARRVARLDVNATDTRDSGDADASELGEATAALARILGATPNPSDMTLTPVNNQVELYQVRWGLCLFLLDIAISPSFPDTARQLGADLAAAGTLEAQIVALENIVTPVTPSEGSLYLEARSSANDDVTREAAQKAIDLIEDYVLPLLSNHRERIAPLLQRGPKRADVTGLMADGEDPPLFFSLFGETARRIPWTGPLVARGSDGVEDIRAWLDALAAEASDPTQPATAPGEHPPLLYQLLKRSIANAHDADRADMRAGIATLAAAARDGRMSDPADTLETLMGEVLGACMYRLDAWLSGRAADRLAALRREKPLGLEVGGFGWVLGLERSTEPASSQGFIHAPSLDHAATAAILRSGWSALGDGALGVDVSSARARAATWIVDGVRDGHRLGELLGQSLERRLHDALLDRWIEQIRNAVLVGTGRSGEQPVGIVDGFVAARAWLGGDEVAPLTAEEAEVRKELNKVVNRAGDDETRLRDTLVLHAADLDAVADAHVFASVHAIVRGTPDRAGATLAATGHAASAPPPLTALRTSRGGQRIAHRVVVLLAAVAGESAATSPAAIAEPTLDAWASSMLRLDLIGFGAWVEENGTKSWQGPYTLAGMGFGALEFLAHLPSGDRLVKGGGLVRRLVWTLERAAAGAGRSITVTIDTELSGGDGGALLPLSLALAAAQALRAVVHGGRAADDSDLATTTVDSTVDTSAVDTREGLLAQAASTAATRLRTALDIAAPTAELLDACAALAAWNIAGAIPRAGLADLATSSDTGDRDALRAEAESIHRRMQARIDARAAVQGDDLAAALARIHALLPGAVMLPPFTPAALAAVRVAEKSSPSRLGAPENAVPWLHQVGRVRERVHAAASAIDLVEVATGVRFQPTLIQLPDYPDEGWAATSRPTHDSSPRTCILSLTPLPTSASLAGIAVDAWTEVIPDMTAATGIAVHFDAPSARPPQAWLVAVPPSEGWTHDKVLAVVRQTLDRARHRAAGPADIEGFGQYLPATYLADATDPGPRRRREGAS